MGMETVTNYTCDRCGRSEIKDGVTILTLTVRPRAGRHVPGLGKPDVTAHICRDNCLKMIKAALRPVGKPGQYDRKAAAARRAAQGGTKPATKAAGRKGATKGTTKPSGISRSGESLITKSPRTKGSTKNGSTARSGKISGTPVPVAQDTPESASEARARVVKEVRSITRTPVGGFAKGYNYRAERRMIAEREAAAAE